MSTDFNHPNESHSDSPFPDFSFQYVLDHVFLKDRPDTQPATVELMRRHIARWNTLTGNCPANQVNREQLIRFRETCVSHGLAATTTNTHLKTIIKLTNLAGFTVDSRKVFVAKQIPVATLTLAELNRVWLITDQAQWPSAKASDGRAVWCDIPAAEWWRSLFMLAYSTGLGRAALFGLKWQQVEPNRIRTDSANGVKAQLLPIPAPLRPWLELLRQSKTETVLGRTDRAPFDGEIARLGHLAGVAPFGLQEIRYLSAGQWARAGAGCDQLILNQKYQVKAVESHFKQLSDACDALAFPADMLVSPIVPEQQAQKHDEELPGCTRSELVASPLQLPKRKLTELDPSKLNHPHVTLRDAVEAYLWGIRLQGGTEHQEQARIILTRMAEALHAQASSSGSETNQRDVSELRELTTHDLRQFLAYRKSQPGTKGRPLAAATLNKEIRYINGFLNYVDSDRRTFGLPLDWITPVVSRIREPKRIPRSLSPALLESIFDACVHARRPVVPGIPAVDGWRLLLYLAFTTSMRRRALFELPRPPDEDLDEKVLRVSADSDKTGEERIYCLTETACTIIRRIPAKPGEPMFVWSGNFRSMYTELHRIQTAGGIPEAAHGLLHDLRRSTATHMANQGASSLIVQRQLGHTDPRVTEKHYIGLLSDQQRAAVDRLMIPKALLARPSNPANEEADAA